MQRSVAGIEWTGIRRKNLYRVGHKGKVCVISHGGYACAKGIKMQLKGSPLQGFTIIVYAAYCYGNISIAMVTRYCYGDSVSLWQLSVLLWQLSLLLW